MPVYKFDLTVEIEADDIDQACNFLDDIEWPRLRILSDYPHSDNPDDYPEND